MMFLLLGLVVMGVLLWNMNQEGTKELKFYELHNAIVAPGAVASGEPPATASKGPRIIENVTIVGSSEIHGDFTPEQKLYPG